jgi:hypothetical protein
VLAERWRIHYNTVRPQSSLRYPHEQLYSAVNNWNVTYVVPHNIAFPSRI